MTIRELEILDIWQSATERSTEKEIDRLCDAIGELNALKKHRDGAHIIRANRKRIANALISLLEIYIETMPTEVAGA